MAVSASSRGRWRKILNEDGKKNDGRSNCDKCGRHVAEVLAHADAERGTDPAGDGVDPPGLASALQR